MTTRNLHSLFSPASIAIIGASAEQGSVGHVLARNALAAGFGGLLSLVNPHAPEIMGVRAAARISDLPQPPDLAIIATPPATLPSIIDQLGRAGCKAAVVITAGLDAATRSAMLVAARPHLLRILGPNCLGFLSPARGINASFAQAGARPGSLALLSQSGAIATSMLDWANGNSVGFSHIASLGDMADIDFGDLLDYLALDDATKAILVYAENITDARKFMSAARIAARSKPVVMIKAGRSAAGAKAAASHTGALAGSDLVYDAALRRAGILRVNSLEEMFEAAQTLVAGVIAKSDRLTVLTNGGGLGVMAVDALESSGGRLSALSDTARRAMDAALPPAWSHGNPVDILGDAPGDRYERAISTLAREAADDVLLVMNCPTGVADSSAAADSVIAARAAHPHVSMLGCWMGEATAEPVRRRLLQSGVPSFASPESAVRAFMQLVERRRGLERLNEVPGRSRAASDPRRVEEARALLRSVLADGRTILTEPESKRLLSLYGVPVAQTGVAGNPSEAEALAATITPPYALKILSRDITHKSDVGGVRLDLATPADVRKAAEDMLVTVASHAPSARIDGFTVQTMVRRPMAVETIVGVTTDPTFGPCILFGHGGVATEVLRDRVVGLPPLNETLAADMIERTRVAALLRGYRDRPRADFSALASALVTLSDMTAELAELSELDINPLLVDDRGVIALDARVVVRATDAQATTRLAIKPYPSDLNVQATFGAERYVLRPVLPEDGAQLASLAGDPGVERPLRPFKADIAAAVIGSRLAQIDYDREMVFVALDAAGNVVGACRLTFDPEFETAEMGALLRADLWENGVGAKLLQTSLDYAWTRGARLVWGELAMEGERATGVALSLGASLGDSLAGGGRRVEFAPVRQKPAE